MKALGTRRAEPRPPARRSFVTLAVVALLQLLLSGAFILLFSWTYSFGRRFVLYHVLLVSVLIGGILLGSAALVRFGWLRTRRRQRALALVIGSGSAVLTLLYTVDFATNRLAIGNLNYELVRDYALWAIGVHNDSLQVSTWIYAAVAALFVVIPLTLAAVAAPLTDAVDRLVPEGRASGGFAAMLASVGAAGLGLFLLSGFMIDAGLLHRDPIVGFFRRQGAAGRFDWFVNFQRQRQRVQDERAAYAKRGGDATRNVVVIMVDSLRADHMQIYGYPRETTPFLARLEREGHLRKVDMALSMCPQSACGILSTMSSKNVRTLQYDFKVFDVLRDIGYRLYFVLGGRHSWEGLHQAYGDEQDLYFDGSSSVRASWEDDRMIAEGLEHVPANDGRDKAFFYIHLMSAHLSGAKWPEFRRFEPAGVEMDLSALLRGERPVDQAINNYDNGVLQADAVIEDVFTRLRSLGYLDHSLVVMLADHGEELGERGRNSFGHGGSLHQESIRIPLLIYDPEPVVYRNLDVATQIDVAPTIVDRLGLSLPSSWTGRSLLSSEPSETVVLGNGHQCGGVIHRAGPALYKYLGCGTADDDEELYDLDADPREQRNLVGRADTSPLRLMRDALRQDRTRTQ